MWTSFTRLPLISGGLAQVARTFKLTFSIHLEENENLINDVMILHESVRWMYFNIFHCLRLDLHPKPSTTRSELGEVWEEMSLTYHGKVWMINQMICHHFDILTMSS